ncbi:phage tail tip fiber protein [Enterobacter sichuanensis]|uniref:phage tail tip fiber protein n=1 Tax=Enterobacter sichuanensis TaxID=2071710 RepID=UPI00388D7631
MKQEYYSPLGVELECDQKALDEICEEIRSSKAFEKLINGTPIHCQVHITDTMIGDAAVSANYSVKMNVNHGGKLHVAGMAVCIEGDQRKVVFEADRFKVNEAAQSASNNEETAFNGGLAFGGFHGQLVMMELIPLMAIMPPLNQSVQLLQRQAQPPRRD